LKSSHCSMILGMKFYSTDGLPNVEYRSAAEKAIDPSDVYFERIDKRWTDS